MRAFAREEVAPLAREIDREQRFPHESWQRAAELGLLGIGAPEENGGAGLGLMEMCLMGEELAAVCVSTCATVLHQADLVVGRIVRHGSDEQRARYLPGFCDGSVIGCLAMTEHGAGSDVLSLQTRAKRVDGGWLLNGSKTFITTAPVADVALVYARTGDSDDRSLGLFAVQSSAEGYVRGKKFSKMGWRGSPTGELAFTDCFVSDDDVIGDAAAGRDIMFSGLDSERIVMAAECIGLARGALDVSIAYSGQREQFGKPISQFQLIQEKLANMYAETEALRSMTWRAARAVDTGHKDEIMLLASACKLFGADVAMRATTEAVQVLGGYGYTDEFPVERFMRDAKLMQIGGGTSEIMRWLIGRTLVK